MKELPLAFAALRGFPQFVLWKLVASRRQAGKFDKLPCDINGKICSAHDYSKWLDVDTAIQAAASLPGDYGVGFTFTKDDPFFFVDIDGAYGESGWSPTSTELCTSFSGAAVEVSASGRGLHIIGQYSGEEPDHGCKNIPLSLEYYTSERFVALTGNGATGDSNTVHNAALSSITAQYFPVTAEDRVHQDWTTEHNAVSRPIGDDLALVKAAVKSKSMFGGKATFKQLWDADEDALSGFYPPNSDEDKYDASSADAALAQHLSFWAGGNCERIEQLMRMSGLTREKWNYHKSYMTRTITGAVARGQQWYNPSKDCKPVDITEVVTPVSRGSGFQLASSTEQLEIFKDCIYVTSIDAIMTPNGTFLNQSRFNAKYGGYEFMIDDEGNAKSKKAWDAFTQSHSTAFPKVDGTTFRPDLPERSIIETEGLRLINTYMDPKVSMIKGDVTPFLNHLGLLFPNERDRMIVLAYMASCLQYIGRKFKWAPLIQGCVGNGKTFFTEAVAYAVGHRYTHMPRADQLAEKFNDWYFNKAFIGVEDIYVPHAKNDTMEILKPMITGERLARRSMNTDQVMETSCANFMFNSNHKDAIGAAVNDRRYAVFFTPQQDKDELEALGLGQAYFTALYDWANNGGWANIAEYLSTFDIPDEFNPAKGCTTAPNTTSTVEAKEAGLGMIEQEILEAIDGDQWGFANGWISSFALDSLLRDARKDNTISINKRKEIIKNLGFIPHPNLSGGRLNNPIAGVKGKPRLYVRPNSVEAGLEKSNVIGAYFVAAQGDILARLPKELLDSSVNKV